MATTSYRGTAAGARLFNDIHIIRVPFIGNPNMRPGTDSTKDERFVNCYLDPVKSPVTGEIKYWLTKRPGLAPFIRPPAGAAVGRGVLSWKGHLYSVFGTQLYKDTTNLGVTLTTSTGRCGIAYTRPGATNQYICINDGVKLYCIADVTGVVSTVTTNFPSPNTTDLVYKDGYFFVLKFDNTLWNCNLDDPITWDPTKFITAQMSPSSGVGLANQTNVMFVMGNNSIQAFNDVANPTGSPMQNMESAQQQVGCASQGSIVSDEAQVTWVSASNTGGYSVYTLDGITGIKEISTSTINRLIKTDNPSLVYANMIRIGGRRFYALTLPVNNRTFLYDYETSLWVEWLDATGLLAFPMADSTQHTGTNSLIIQHTTNGWLYNFNPAIYQDDSISFSVLARFGRLDLDTSNRKFCRKADLIGDRQATTTNVLLQYSDDDYVTLSTARILDVNQSHVFCTNLGNFRRRSWQISYTGNNPLREEALELKIRLGDD